MLRRILTITLSLVLLSSCAPSTERVSNKDFDSHLKRLSSVESKNQRVDYKNKNGTFYTITQEKIREVAFTGYKYKGEVLGSKSSPFRIYLYPEVFFKTGGSFQRVILCQSKEECTDVTLAYLDPNRQFTPKPIPGKFYGLSLLDISELANRNAPAIQRLKFILQAREKGLQRLYTFSKNETKVYTPKDRVNIVKKRKGETCYAWADNQEAMSTQSYRFNSCFIGDNFTSGDLAEYKLGITSVKEIVSLEPFGGKVKLLTSEYKLSPYGRLYLSNYQGIDSRYISSLEYQPVLPNKEIKN